MEYSKYGDTDSKYGWQVDHIVPASFLEEKGVSENDRDNIINLRPMQRKNNDVKDKDYPTFDSAVTSFDGRYINKDDTYTFNK